MNSTLPRIITTLVALVITAGIAYWLGSRTRESSPSNSDLPQVERKVLYWYDPMVPQQHFDKPGKSPFMDMQLVPKYAGEGEANGVVVSAASVQNLGVRTQTAEVERLITNVHASGNIAWDQRATRDVSARVDAVIDKLHVRADSERVRRGQVLADLIAPQWSAAAQEYLVLQSMQSADARDLRAAARDRLRVLGMSETQILSLRNGQGSIALHAPMDGVVSELAVREGQSVQAGMLLMRINGLDTVWVEVALAQSQTVWVRDGAPVRIRIDAFPGEEFSGTLELLPAELDPATRSLRARIVVANPHHRLLPGMFAELEIEGTPDEPHPLVPDAALIATGDDQRVMIETGAGRFTPVRVVTGRSAGGRTEILEGLQGGERVVVNGQFLIDSEASLQGALQRLSTPAEADRVNHLHHEMKAQAAPAVDHSAHDHGQAHATTQDEKAVPADPHAHHGKNDSENPEPQP
jgi:Cu(I)/Ag(I) efflux system membrane fusion protein